MQSEDGKNGRYVLTAYETEEVVTKREPSRQRTFHHIEAAKQIAQDFILSKRFVLVEIYDMSLFENILSERPLDAKGEGSDKPYGVLMYAQIIPEELRKGFDLGEDDEGLCLTFISNHAIDLAETANAFVGYVNVEEFATNVSDEGCHVQTVLKLKDARSFKDDLTVGLADKAVPNGWDKIEAGAEIFPEPSAQSNWFTHVMDVGELSLCDGFIIQTKGCNDVSGYWDAYEILLDNVDHFDESFDTFLKRFGIESRMIEIDGFVKRMP